MLAGAKTPTAATRVADAVETLKAGAAPATPITIDSQTDNDPAANFLSVVMRDPLLLLFAFLLMYRTYLA
jgi:hypothetical protein